LMSVTQLQVAADLTDGVSTVINVVNQRDWNANDFVTGATTTATTTATAASEFDLVLDLAYVKLKEVFYAPLTLTLGRQDLLFGRGFIIGWNPQDSQGIIQADEFTAVQSFDAVRGTLDFSPWTVDVVYSKIDENSHNAEDDSDLWIFNANYKFAEYNAVAEGYYVIQLDKAALSGATGTANNDTYTAGGRIQFDPISQMTLGGELALQFGNYRAVATSAERDREAWAMDLFVDYRFKDNPWNAAVNLEYVYLSGESDLSSTSAQSYGAWNAPFRGPTYGRVHEYLEGYYLTAQTNDQAPTQNMQHVCFTGSIVPMTDLSLTGAFYHIWTAEDAHSTITDPNTPALSDHIGNELDLTLTYSYTEDVSFKLMADWFFPGDLYSSPNDSTASQVISQVSVVF
ncbi:MAG: alginate export family protein, partial [Candidatus Omnitrophica bacterium]|nr:alginate export family protein [Candidatus Omnitrophota bacterium]